MPETAGVHELKIHLLGSFQIDIRSQPLDLLAWRRQVKRLVKLLALAPGHRLQKEQILEALWPDQDPTHTDNSLRQVLYLGRKGFDQAGLAGPQVLHLEEGWVELNPAERVWVDVEQFEQAGARRQKTVEAYEAALALYAGELLPEDRFEDWAAYRRENLRALHLQMIKDFAHLYESSQEYENAVEWLNRGLESDPTDEDLHASLMRNYAWLGWCSKALRQYDRLEEVLKRELDLEPDPAVQKLHQSILDDCFPAPVPAPPPPAPGAAGLPHHNLPVLRTSLVGRTQEVQQVQELLAHSSLVTLTGSGGVGKTRLSLQIAEKVLESFADGVWYVELAALSDPELVPQLVAAILGVGADLGQSILASLTSYLHSRQVLLVLDNCEHLRDACAGLVDSLLNACLRLKVLTSSREPLGVAGEVTYRVPSLTFPAPGQAFAPEDAVEYAAVRLFVIRAGVVRPGFEVNAGNAASLARICQRLDGIPLAIELAAARVGVLTLDQLAHRLDDAFRLLTGGSRSALPRQQTLRATIDWSYGLLNPQERRLFRRLAVFAGGCTLEAGEVICSGAGLEAGDVFDLLASLVAKSMVMVDFQKDADATRYRLLDTVRQYAREKLFDAGESADLRHRHLDYYLALSEHAESQLRSAGRLEWSQGLKVELDNLRTAFEWAYQDPSRAQAGLRMVTAIGFRFLTANGYLKDALDWVMKGLELAEGQPDQPLLRARAYNLLGEGYENQRNYPGVLEWVEKSLPILREIGPPAYPDLAWALWDYGIAVNTIYNDINRAIEAIDESIQISRQMGLAGAWYLGMSLYDRSMFAFAEDGDLVYRLAQESRQAFIQSGDRWSVCAPLHQLGLLSENAEDFHQALRYFEEAGRLAEEVGDQPSLSYIHLHLGRVHRKLGSIGKAIQYHTNYVRLWSTMGNQGAMKEGFVNLGLDWFCLGNNQTGSAQKGSHLRAMTLISIAEMQRSLPYSFLNDPELFDQAINTCRREWGEAEFQRVWDAGQAMGLDEAVAFTLALPAHP
jgi:predicted ATPase/DNA-binding SARP family transcriptional activator